MRPIQRIGLTGGNGFLGRAIISTAQQRRVAVTALSREQRTPGTGISWVRGDIGDNSALARVVDGADALVHCAATLDGTGEEIIRSIVDGTRAAARAATAKGIRFIHLSSLAVVSSEPSTVTSESVAVDERPETRGAYTQGKIAAEKVLEEPEFATLEKTIVRPAQLVGDGLGSFPPSLGLEFGRIRVLLSTGSSLLPVVHVDDVAEAIWLLLASVLPPTLVHLIDPRQVSRSETIEALRRRGVAGAHLPTLSVGPIIGPLAWVGMHIPGKVGAISRRLRSLDSVVSWDNSVASGIGWRPSHLPSWLDSPGEGATDETDI